MKKIFILGSFALAGLSFLSSCKKEEAPYSELSDAKAGGRVYIARSTGNMQNLTIFPYQDEARTFEFSTAFGALGLPARAISVKLAVDDRAFDSLNVSRIAQGLPAFQKFPSDAYSISSMEATIPAGKLNSELIRLSYFPKKFNDKTDYLLPISISAADGYSIGTNKTIFIIAPRLTDILASKTGWTVTASSQELVGEGTANGKAEFLIDGNVATYWHSKWQAPAPVFPHSFSIDMQTEVYVTRVDLVARQNNNNGFTVFNLEGSKDGNTWSSLGTNLAFDPLNKAAQAYPITPGYWRHIRITAVRAASTTTTSTHLGEVNIYRY